MNNYEILKWDSDFFGFIVARINDKCILPEDFGKVYEELKKKNVKLIYWPSDPNFRFQHEISRKFNGQLIDIKTEYEKDITEADRYLIEGKIIPELYKNDEPDDNVLKIAVQCGNYSRFKTDPNFPSVKFEELYKTWIIKSLTGDMADKVIITKNNDQVSGLITIKCNKGIGNIGLIGVHNDYRGMGLGGILIKTALNYFMDNKCYKANVITQGANKAACHLYEKYGFKINHISNFYHYWI